MNTPHDPSSGYRAANKNPPSTKPFEPLCVLDRKTFSRVIQFKPGHTHTGEYYQRFVPTEETVCKCGAQLRTRKHILFSCPIHAGHRYLLGNRKTAWYEHLINDKHGVMKLTNFLKRTKHSTRTTIKQDSA